MGINPELGLVAAACGNLWPGMEPVIGGAELRGAAAPGGTGAWNVGFVSPCKCHESNWDNKLQKEFEFANTEQSKLKPIRTIIGIKPITHLTIAQFT